MYTTQDRGLIAVYYALEAVLAVFVDQCFRLEVADGLASACLRCFGLGAARNPRWGC